MVCGKIWKWWVENFSPEQKKTVNFLWFFFLSRRENAMTFQHMNWTGVYKDMKENLYINVLHSSIKKSIENYIEKLEGKL